PPELHYLDLHDALPISPSAKVHVATVLSCAIPDYNRAQVQAFLHVTGRGWCDFISYLPGEPLFIIRDYPDERWQTAIVSAAEQLDRKSTRLNSSHVKIS